MKLKKQRKQVDENVNAGLIKLICVLNGMDHNIYLRQVGMWNNGICMKDKDFIKSSKLNWRSDKTLDITDIIFRARFGTLVCDSLLGNTKKFKDITLDAYDIKKKSKTQVAIDESKKALHACTMMVDDILNNNRNWYDSIRNVDNCCMSLCTGDVVDLRYFIEMLVCSAKLSSSHNIITGRSRNNADILHDILKLGYISITNDVECTDCIRLGKLKGCDIDMDLSEVLYKYGKKLRKHIKHNKKSTNPLFIAFMEANPKIYSNNRYAENPDILLALFALTYLKFIINDKTLNMYIDHIMNTNLILTKKLPKEQPVDLSSRIDMMFG